METTLVAGTDYTVALNADQNVSPGGSITTMGLSSPCAAPKTISLSRAPDVGAHQNGALDMKFGLEAAK